MSNVIPIRARSRDSRLLVIGLGIAALAGIGFLALPTKEEEPHKVEAISSRAVSRSMPICNHGRRINCVVDGDTIWLDGEKIRLDSINAPEVEGRCDRERTLAARATRRLSELLTASAFSVSRTGQDRYDRTLARVTIDGRDVGTTLVGEGLAHPWHGQKRGWC